MKIVVLTGSPHRKGTSSALAAAFIRGVEETGNDVYRFDAAFRNVHACIACDHCLTHDGACVFKDDMAELNPRVLEADVIVFTTQIYYYGLPAQIKTVVDRFYAHNDALMHGKQTVLLLTMEDDTDESAESVLVWNRNMNRYMDWTSAGTVVAHGSSTPEALRQKYVDQAYELGKSLA